MSNPLREQFGFNTDLVGYTQWTPVPDVNVLVSNTTESYYINDAGTVTVDVCMAFVPNADITNFAFTTLPVAAANPQTVNIIANLRLVEDNSSNIVAIYDLNAAVSDITINLLTDGTTLNQGEFYIVSGTLTYTAA